MIDEKEIALQLTLKYLEICNPFDAPRHTPLSAEELENDSKKISGIYNAIFRFKYQVRFISSHLMTL